MRTIKTALTCGIIGLAAIGLTGCVGAAQAAGGGEPIPVVAPGAVEQSTFQTEALADGVVSRSEYQTAFGNFQSCMSKRGYDVIVLDMKSTPIDIRIPAEAVNSGADAKCYATEYQAVDYAWQHVNQDQTANVAMLDNCLKANGLDIPETRAGKIDALQNARIDIGKSCVK